MRAQKFFRYLWRIDALLILIAMGAITFAVCALIFQEFSGRAALRRNAATGIPVAAEPRVDLVLGHAEAIPGTAVLRADLTVRAEGKGFSSGGYYETRNIIFIDPTQKIAHWLLPDSDHVISERFDVKDHQEPERQKIVATAALIKARDGQTELVSGRLLLFDLTGKNVVEVANDVRDLHLATLNGNELSLLYERNRRLVSAIFDSSSFSKKKEQEIDVPQLK